MRALAVQGWLTIALVLTVALHSPTATAAKTEGYSTTTYVLGAAVGGVLAVAAAPIVIGAVAGVAAGGPLAGGLFAGAQGAGVAAGSFLAGVHSVAMGGAMSGALTTAVAGAGAAAGTGALKALEKIQSRL